VVDGSTAPVRLGGDARRTEDAAGAGVDAADLADQAGLGSLGH